MGGKESYRKLAHAVVVALGLAIKFIIFVFFLVSY